jgi:hypothetical protein
LKNLAVYIQHSDGEKKVDRGTIKYDSNGNPIGIEIEITKFSTFTIIGVSNMAPKASNIVLSGKAQVGEKLTAAYTYTDTDKDEQGNSVFKWYRADSENGINKRIIPGANMLAYTLTKEDQGKFVIFEVTPVAKTGVVTGEAVSASIKVPLPIIPKDPEQTKPIKYSGHLKLGVIKSKTYAQKLVSIIRSNYKGANVTFKKEGSYYKIEADFIDKTTAQNAAKDMKKKKLIVNYYIY